MEPPGRSTVLVALLASLDVLLVASATLSAGTGLLGIALLVLVALLAGLDVLLVRGVVAATAMVLVGLRHEKYLHRMRTGFD